MRRNRCSPALSPRFGCRHFLSACFATSSVAGRFCSSLLADDAHRAASSGRNRPAIFAPRLFQQALRFPPDHQLVFDARQRADLRARAAAQPGGNLMLIPAEYRQRPVI